MTDKTMTTYDESGRALTETQGDVTMPADYSFDCVNDYVHCHDTNYEDLQCLALGMATRIEKLTDALKPFVECAEKIDDDEDDEEWAKFRLLVKHYREARDALVVK